MANVLAVAGAAFIFFSVFFLIIGIQASVVGLLLWGLFEMLAAGGILTTTFVWWHYGLMGLVISRLAAILFPSTNISTTQLNGLRERLK